MNIHREVVVYAVLLVALAANPVWFFPHAEEPMYEYRAVELTDENRFRYVEGHPEVLQCYDARDRACGFEAFALDGGVVVDASNVVYSGGSAKYRYVVFPSGFYEPVMNHSGGQVRLTLESRSVFEVLRNLSYPFADASGRARTVVRRGTATFHDEITLRDRIVRRNGTVYALHRTRYRWQRYPRFFPEVRWLLWVGTVPLSLAAMWRWT